MATNGISTLISANPKNLDPIIAERQQRLESLTENLNNKHNVDATAKELHELLSKPSLIDFDFDKVMNLEPRPASILWILILSACQYGSQTPLLCELPELIVKNAKVLKKININAFVQDGPGYESKISIMSMLVSIADEQAWAKNTLIAILKDYDQPIECISTLFVTNLGDSDSDRPFDVLLALCQKGSEWAANFLAKLLEQLTPEAMEAFDFPDQLDLDDFLSENGEKLIPIFPKYPQLLLGCLSQPENLFLAVINNRILVNRYIDEGHEALVTLMVLAGVNLNKTTLNRKARGHVDNIEKLLTCALEEIRAFTNKTAPYFSAEVREILNLWTMQSSLQDHLKGLPSFVVQKAFAMWFAKHPQENPITSQDVLRTRMARAYWEAQRATKQPVQQTKREVVNIIQATLTDTATSLIPAFLNQAQRKGCAAKIALISGPLNAKNVKQAVTEGVQYTDDRISLK